MVRVVTVRAGLLALAALWIAGCTRPPPTLDRVRALMASGQLEQACEAARALVDRPGARATRLDRVRVWVGCLARRGELQRARDLLARRSSADALRSYGMALVLLAESPKSPGRALDLLSRAGARWPDQAEIPYRMGVVLLANGQPGPALKRLDQACARRRSAKCVVARAHALLDLGREQDAVSAVGEVPALRPSRSDIVRGRALIRRLMGQRRSRLAADAREALDRALEQRSDHVRLLQLGALKQKYPGVALLFTEIGLASLRLERMSDTITALKRAAELAPLDPRNPYYLAVAYESRVRPKEAEKFYRRALELDPFLVPAAAALQKLLVGRGARADAVTVAEHLAAIDPGPASQRVAARANLVAGRTARALTLYLELAQAKADDFEAHLRVAQILLSQSEKAKSGSGRTLQCRRAREHLDHAAKARPGSPDVERLSKRLSACR